MKPQDEFPWLKWLPLGLAAIAAYALLLTVTT